MNTQALKQIVRFYAWFMPSPIFPGARFTGASGGNFGVK